MTLLALAGDIARRLNRPGEPQAVLSGVAAAVQAGTGARSVSIWVPRPTAGHVGGDQRAAGAAGADLVPSLDHIPARAGGLRVPVTREGVTLALLEAEGGAEEALVGLVAEMIAPYLASLGLAAALQRGAGWAGA